MILTVSQMQQVEKAAFDRGIKAIDLMEQAGKGIAERVQQFFPNSETCVLYCGKGNNAGDVLVAGRFLAAVGWNVFVRTTFPEQEMSELAQQQLQCLKKEKFFLREDPFYLKKKKRLIFLDGLLGIGAQGEPRGKIKVLINELNDQRKKEGAFVVAADLPSGLDATTGIPSKSCVVADLTVTIACAKTGLIADTATNYVGRLAVVPLPDLNLTRIFHPSLLREPGRPMDTALDLNLDSDSMDTYSHRPSSAPALSHQPSQLPRHESDEISGLNSVVENSDFTQYPFPQKVFSKTSCTMQVSRSFIKTIFQKSPYTNSSISTAELRLKTKKENEIEIITSESLRALLPSRSFDVHKGMFGRVGILAGSRGYLGAARLASVASLHAGAGLVTLFALPEIYELLATAISPEVMVQPIQSYSEIFSKSLDVLAIGPGLGLQHHDEILEVIEKATIPCVVDADALNVLASDMTRLLKAHGLRLLTPHPGEMERLFPRHNRTRAAWATDFVQKYSVTLLLKGARTIVAEKQRGIAYNTTGNPGMASGGMGDVLTGVAAAFLANGRQPREAAMLGAWLCGYAAELAVFRGAASQESLMASDVINNLGRAMKNLRARV